MGEVGIDQGGPTGRFFTGKLLIAINIIIRNYFRTYIFWDIYKINFMKSNTYLLKKPKAI